MKRPVKKPGAASRPERMPRVEAAALRDHGSDQQIDRVWERLERNLVMGPTPSVPTSAAGRGSRWSLIAAGMAAGFAAGLFTSGWLDEDPDKAPVVKLSDADDARSLEVFAAGDTQKSYQLDSGVELVLEPGSIVETVRAAGNKRGLTLRLVRGEAKLTTPDGDSEPLALQIGHAEVATAAGSMRVRVDGETAQLEMLRGSASVTEPNIEDPAGEPQRSVVGEREKRQVRVQVLTARLNPPRTAPVSSAAAPDSDALDSDDASGATGISPNEEPVAAAAPPAWMSACDRGDYSGAVGLLQQQAGSVSGGLRGVTDPAYLNCVATGQEARDRESAKRIYDRVVREHGNDGQAMVAAAALARLYRGEDDAKAEEYAQKAEDLSKGRLQSATRLCNSVMAASSRGDHVAVRDLAQQYKDQYPGGQCSDAIDGILAKLPKEEKALAPPAPPAEDTTYDEVDDAGAE